MESLFSGFSSVNLAAWKARLAQDLKGTTFDDLITGAEDGIPISPFYNRENSTSGTTDLFENPDWDICVRIRVSKEQEANKLALAALTGGASGLIFDLQQQEVVDYPKLLEGIALPYILIVFKISHNAGQLIAGFKSYLKQKDLKPGTINYVFDYDPIFSLLNGSEPLSAPASAYSVFAAGSKAVSQISADATLFQNAGANSAFQMACTLAQLNEYLTILDKDQKCKEINQVYVSIAVGTGFFEEIAKLRALRKILPLLFNSYGIQPEIRLHIVSSDLYRAPFDAYNNILRDSISGMAGVLGGCDSLEIHHFDLNKEKQNPAFSERLARNQQLIFKEESYLNKVADIASGSFYIETLTEAIAEKAWIYFQETEQKGGLLACFDQGVLQDQIQEQSAQLINEYKSGKRVLVGVNKYPNAIDLPQQTQAQKPNTKYLSSLNLAMEIV